MCDELKEVIVDDVKDYVDMHVDNVKLSVVEGLATVTGSAIALVICLFLVNLALMLLTVVLLYLLDMLIHSMIWSAVILAVIYLIVGIWVFLKPGGLRNSMVKVFAPMLFPTRKYDDDDE